MARRVYDKKIAKNSLVRQLLKEIRELGYTVKFVPSWRQLGIYDAYGMHERTLSTKIIWCARYRKDGTPRTAADVAFILAHELRHALHMRKGLYDAYYGRREVETLADLGIAVAVGVRAERDCDRYARERLKEAGVYTPLLHRRYPLRKVGMYLQYRRAQLRRCLLDAIMYGKPTNNIRKELKKTRKHLRRDEPWQKEK